MTKMAETATNDRLQYAVAAVLAFGAAGATGILSLSEGSYFQPYFGNVHPLLVIALVTVLGVVSLSFLNSRGWFQIYATRKSLKGAFFSASVATLFAIVMVLVDLGSRFPRNLNVPPPESLLFYPTMAYVAEIAFHSLPLSLLLFCLGPAFKKLNVNSVIWLCIALASFLEPIFQMRLRTWEKPLSWAEVYVGPHVFVFNLLQIYVFRRYDFVAMYSFRLVYYVYWHIVWGYLRVQWLF